MNRKTNEQTPLFDRQSQIVVSPNANCSNINNDSFDVSSEFNASIYALPEDEIYLFEKAPLLLSKPPSSSNGLKNEGILDYLCQLEENVDEEDDIKTPTVESKPLDLVKIIQV